METIELRNPTTEGLSPEQFEVIGQKVSFRLAQRPGSYVVLTESLSSHDVGRHRGGVAAALRGCPVPAVVGGITSDRLYPLRLQEELAELLPGCDGLQVVDSVFGHDGFLVETEAVGELVRQTLDVAAAKGACPR